MLVLQKCVTLGTSKMPSTTTASSSTSSEDRAGSFVGTELPSIVKEQLVNRYNGTGQRYWS